MLLLEVVNCTDLFLEEHAESCNHYFPKTGLVWGFFFLICHSVTSVTRAFCQSQCELCFTHIPCSKYHLYFTIPVYETLPQLCPGWAWLWPQLSVEHRVLALSVLCDSNRSLFLLLEQQQPRCLLSSPRTGEQQVFVYGVPQP